jgi:hypothetical protein
MALVKTLSVRQPYATFICAGVKKVENRTWKTDYRGRLLIHASGDNVAYPDTIDTPEAWRNELIRLFDREEEEQWTESMKNFDILQDMCDYFYHRPDNDEILVTDWLKPAVKQYGYAMPNQAIIGECVLADIVQDSDDPFAEPGAYHWIMEKPVIYKKYIMNVFGKLRLWTFDIPELETISVTDVSKIR